MEIPWYKRLRWRLIAPQFWVVLVGVGVMMITLWVFMLRTAPEVVSQQLTQLLQNPNSIAQVKSDLIASYRNAVVLSVLLAAVAALLAGIISSVLLWRMIIDPLQKVAASSQRIANGRFSERVSVANNSGLAMAQLVLSFNQMAETLEQVEAQRVVLLANISHELRTPLTGLQGYLEGLTDDLFPANEETFSWMSQEIHRLRRLVDDIQNLSRIEAGQFAMDIQNFELTAVIQSVVRQLQPAAQENNIALTALLPTPYWVHADADRTTQVLHNLLGNALRYTPSDGHITVAMRRDGRFVSVAVQDSGIGIPPESLPYLFERFFRVDQSRARTSGGSGIGLTISRHLVWAMGGELTAVSEGHGHGSTFTFTLPLAQERTAV